MAWTVSVAFIDCMHRTVGFFQYCFDRFFILEWELFSESDWHHLDKTHMDWIFLRQSCNPDEVFFFLDHRNAVDLQGKSRMCKCCFDSLKYLFQSVTSRYFLNSSGSKVSRLILMASIPASSNASSCSASRIPFVVNVTFSIPGSP